MFSSHNRLHRGPQPWALRNLKAGHLTRLPGRLWAYWEGLLAYGAIRNREYEAQDHALRIDSAFNYELVTYYISPEDQLAQLKATGFLPGDTYDLNGELVDASASPEDSWLYYTARAAT